MKRASLFLFVIILLLALFSVYFGFFNNGNGIKVTKNDSSWLENLTKGQGVYYESFGGHLEKCDYNGQIVYYAESRCCDFYNYLYNKEGSLICAPSGGIAGGGDGKCSDFDAQKSNCKVIIADEENLRLCPDEWINNQMPCGCNGGDCSGCNDASRQYFIVKGERRELSAFDVDWIKENCNIEPIIVS